MKFTTAIISLLSAGAALATLTPEQQQANVERSSDNVKRHDRAPGYAVEDIPANARGAGSAERVILKE